MNDLRHLAKRDTAIASIGTDAEEHVWKAITTVDTRKPEPLEVNPTAPPTITVLEPLPNKPVGDWNVPAESGFSVWQLLQKFPTLFSAFITLLSGISMKNSTKVTTAVVALIVAIAAIFGYDLSPEVIGIIGSLVGLLIGWLIPAPKTPEEPPTN